MKGHSASKHALEHRVIALLDRDQVDFLDKLSKDALFSTGTKLSRTKIIAAMLDVIRQLHVTASGVKTSQEFEKKIIEAMQEEVRKSEKKA